MSLPRVYFVTCTWEPHQWTFLVAKWICCAPRSTRIGWLEVKLNTGQADVFFMMSCLMRENVFVTLLLWVEEFEGFVEEYLVLSVLTYQKNLWGWFVYFSGWLDWGDSYSKSPLKIFGVTCVVGIVANYFLDSFLFKYSCLFYNDMIAILISVMDIRKSFNIFNVCKAGIEFQLGRVSFS